MGLFDKMLGDFAGAALDLGNELLKKGKTDLSTRFDEEAARKAMKRGEEIGAVVGDHLAALFEVFEETLHDIEGSHEQEAPSAPPPQATVAEATPEAVAASKPQAAKKQPADKKPAAKKTPAKRSSTRKQKP